MFEMQCFDACARCGGRVVLHAQCRDGQSRTVASVTHEFAVFIAVVWGRLQDAIRASDRAVLAFYGPDHPSALTCHPAASYGVRPRTLLAHVLPLPDASARSRCTLQASRLHKPAAVLFEHVSQTIMGLKRQSVLRRRASARGGSCRTSWWRWRRPAGRWPGPAEAFCRP